MRNSNKALIVVPTVAVLFFVFSVFGAVTVTINEQVEYQTIVGFGGTRPGSHTGTLVSDLGLTAHREPITYDGAWNFSHLKALKNLGVKTFIAVPWSPPAYMKTNNSATNGGNLKPNFYDDFAAYLVKYARDFKQQVGLELYGISPQNEPRFVEPYGSCVYNPGQYRDVVRLLGPGLKQAGLKTKIFIAEDMLSAFGPMIIASVLDSIAGKHVDAISVHGYSDGIEPMPTGQAERLWTQAWGFCNGGNRPGKVMPLWMTETSGYADNWEPAKIKTWQGTDAFAPGGLGLATDMFLALKHGKISLWTYWLLTTNSLGQINYTFFYQNTKVRAYDASKMYYKFIRPGAVHVECSPATEDKELLTIAFNDKNNRTLTVILLNLSQSTKTVALKGNNIPDNLKGYRSSAGERCLSVGSVSKISIGLPKRSITALVGENYNPPALSARRRRPATTARATRFSRNYSMRIHSLDGKLVKRSAGAGCSNCGSRKNALAKGVYYSIMEKALGKTKENRVFLAIP